MARAGSGLSGASRFKRRKAYTFFPYFFLPPVPYPWCFRMVRHLQLAGLQLCLPAVVYTICTANMPQAEQIQQAVMHCTIWPCLGTVRTWQLGVLQPLQLPQSSLQLRRLQAFDIKWQKLTLAMYTLRKLGSTAPSSTAAMRASWI